MTTTTRRAIGVGLILTLGLLARSGGAQTPPAPARQVTVFGVRATPGETPADKRLSAVLPQLRRLLPRHGFGLIRSESSRAVAGEAVTCDLSDRYVATSRLVEARDGNGKVRMRFTLSRADKPVFETVVSIPPDQVLFCEQPLPDGSKLLVGLGAR